MDCNKPRVVCAGEHKIITGDCLDILKHYDDDSVDLIVTSPPYEGDYRSYGIDFNLKGQDWVDWCFARYMECVRVCRGLVAWNVDGSTRKFQWSATPALLMADLHRAGVKLRKPAIYSRRGVPGSGGPDWLANLWEPIICSTKGKLPWSDNTACGHPPKYGVGGAPSNRKRDGSRVNRASRGKIEEMIASGGCNPKVNEWAGKELPPGAKFHTKSDRDGDRVQLYIPPAKANPGNIIHASVGGGHLGSPLAHENEAPFSLAIPDLFIRSFCPPGGLVLDPFGGSGTTLHAAVNTGRICHSIDIRDSQRELTLRRFHEAIASLQGSVHPNGGGDRPGEGSDPRPVDSGGGVDPSGEAEPGDYNSDRQD